MDVFSLPSLPSAADRQVNGKRLMLSHGKILLLLLRPVFEKKMLRACGVSNGLSVGAKIETGVRISLLVTMPGAVGI